MTGLETRLDESGGPRGRTGGGAPLQQEYDDFLRK